MSERSFRVTSSGPREHDPLTLPQGIKLSFNYCDQVKIPISFFPALLSCLVYLSQMRFSSRFPGMTFRQLIQLHTWRASFGVVNIVVAAHNTTILQTSRCFHGVVSFITERQLRTVNVSFWRAKQTAPQQSP